jgi:tetratricopeptide (TPR) repeat protein
MKESLNDINIIDTPSSQFDTCIEVLLVLLLTFMPLAFGVVEAWSEEVVIILAASVSICFLLKLIFDKNTSLIWSWTYIPAILFVFTGVFQLIELPTGIVNVISHNTVETKQLLLADLPDAANLLNSMTLTFYPNATKHDLRLVFAATALFFVILNVYRRPDQIKRLLGTVTIIGGFIALLALSQDLFDNGKIYWYVPTISGKANSAAFINHSHYGQFMNLSIGAALGLLLVKLHEAFSNKKITPAIVFEYFSSADTKIIWLLLTMIILGAATVFISLTRGGMISMLIAAGLTTLILSSQYSLKNRVWIILLMVLGAFICVLYVDFNVVYDRLSTLRDLQEAQEGRWQILKDIAIAWTKFPLIGTGLGTHEVVYPMFDHATTAEIASHAENEYAQTAEETGLIGLFLLFVFGIIIWFNYIRNIKSRYLAIRSAAYGLGFGLMAIMIHSLSDFGQHLPANAILSVISCALLINIARVGQQNNSKIELEKKIKNLKGLYIVILLGVSAVWAWSILDADNARKAEASWRKVVSLEQRLSQEQNKLTIQNCKELIYNSAKASDYQPGNIKYKHYLNVYRWYSISRNTDPNTGQIVIPIQAMSFVKQIADEFNKVRLLCPTYGATYCVVGQIEKFILNDPKGAENIRKAFKLAPSDPTVCLVAGTLDFKEKKIAESFKKLSRAVALDNRFFWNAVDLLMNDADRPDLAVALAGDNTSWLSYVENVLSDMTGHEQEAQQVRKKVIELLQKECSQPNASASVFASYAECHIKEKNIEIAIEYYRRAVALEYNQVSWRFEMAKLLAQTGKIQEAIYEARICLRLCPHFTAAEELIANLSVLPSAEYPKNYTP